MAYEGKFSLDEFELYRRARAFRKAIYKLIKTLPTEEKYCLGSQMRRAAISVSNNIAEGHGRWYYQENIRFCRTSRGSIEELIDDLNTCLDENYAQESEVIALKEAAFELIAKVNSYITYLRKNKQGDELS